MASPSSSSSSRHRLPELPREPVDRLVAPVSRFLHIEAGSGVILLLCTVAALGLANSPLAEAFLGFWKTKVGFSFGDSFEFKHSLKHLINDGLMAIFFFVVGLEVKRELVMGELKDFQRAMLPVAAAIGGMVVPAGIYLALQGGTEAERGWGIPMATDIAFVVGCMALFGRRLPGSLRIMLLSLAIVDDIGAIMVIAIGYTEDLDLVMLTLGGVGIVATWLMAKSGVRAVPVYFVVGALVWFFFHESGVHATIAGVILGLMTPAHTWVSRGLLGELMQRANEIFHGREHEESAIGLGSGELRRLELAAREAVSPLERLETLLHPWVGFVIMPVFALANAGVPVSLEAFGDPVAVAVAAGLVVGKPLGVVLASWIAVKAGWTKLPVGVGWGMILGGGCLAGIGFTMALFIAGLALGGEMLDSAKVGILGGSAVSAALGMALLWFYSRRTEGAPARPAA